MLNAQMYSVRELPTRDLHFIDDPYESAEAQALLRELGVVFYRDEDHAHGLVLATTDYPVKGFYHQLIVDEETWEVDEWENPTPQNLVKHGDALAWIQWNKGTLIIGVTEERVLARRS